MIKYRTERVIESGDLDELVTETYGRPYQFQQQDGCKSRGIEYITVPEPEAYDCEDDSIPEVVNGDDYGVSFKAWLARDPKAPLKDEPYCEFVLGKINFWSSINTSTISATC